MITHAPFGHLFACIFMSYFTAFSLYILFIMFTVYMMKYLTSKRTNQLKTFYTKYYIGELRCNCHSLRHSPYKASAHGRICYRLPATPRQSIFIDLPILALFKQRSGALIHHISYFCFFQVVKYNFSLSQSIIVV